MQRATALVFGLAGVGLGVLIALGGFQPTRTARAASGDRYQDYVMSTGVVTLGRQQADGVWLLDYRSGKLLGTVVDVSRGKIVGWTEVDLAAEFQVAPHSDVHFMMVTGFVKQGHSAIYVAETTSGKFGVYSMGANPSGTGVVIFRNEITNFRTVQQQPVQPATSTNSGIPGVPASAAPGLQIPVPTPSPVPPIPGAPAPSTLPPINTNPVIIPQVNR